MDTNNLKDLWNKQDAIPQPDLNELLKSALKLKNKNRNQMLLVMAMGVATMLFILTIGYFIEPELITTRIGVALIILAIIFFLVSSGGLLRLLMKDADQSLNAADYLQLLITIKEKQLVLGTRIMNLYFAALGMGLLLYMIEYTLKMPLIGGLIAYGITAAWILFNWVYLRPRILSKQQAKISEVIKNLEKVNNQLS
ncbi:hypothetical protein [Dyadobacter psychrotolerans]|uniref:Uncharacterized protein n=1 Tax=Dyadobacter psychrotolerans TaxID=2541721 RepID=A0A4R5DDW8_9BACT|nr:hypothetical protein [Dyadobacter psychrotolerans]TDE11969.1 hypothetical protein E0F88_23220 [Dyadobacter psychrotolerans]